MSATELNLTQQQVLRKKANGETVLPDAPETPRRHVIAVLLENHVGALNRVVNLFSARNFNLESVTVGVTEDPAVSRLTIVTSGTRRQIKQVLRLLDRLLDTLSVEDLDPDALVERELCLLRIGYTKANRAELMDIADIFRARVVDVTPETMTFEVTGPAAKVNAFVGMMRPHGIVEMARSGRVAMRRALAYGD
ncbi:acetolactate synthase small subunit [Rhodocaloribacter litoris]|uniref:acetolactate synthase small subunit n=1 Tax=Rhodocaloribacter litoris TaxID=2558931 RepID=UPI00141F6E63|nr:acetolactate synthase small subunit [Rhodocaloribacter litoris]QXD14176.1 acetolactate synthase small subunit [Rhodocaloribacter litoris]GIV59951.1 MAG: acetolactate synthase small subunit [Rhodothermaceae bacterium]